MTTVDVLTQEQAAILRLLNERGPLETRVIAHAAGRDQSQVAADIVVLAERELVSVAERPREEIVADPHAAAFVGEGLPERRVAKFLDGAGGAAPLERVADWAAGQGLRVHEILRWGRARGWFEKTAAPGGARKATLLALRSAARDEVDKPQPDEIALRAALERRLFLDEVEALGLERRAVERLLGGRAELAQIKKRTERIVDVTAKGRTAVEQARVQRPQRTALTADDLRTGAWRNIELKPYDVTLPARRLVAAKVHPLRRIMEQTRHAFLEMGFTEVASPMIESAFWNFDALFQPQDHPARDAQDTFYMAEPDEVALPDPALVERVRLTHEHGWTTGSQGWGYHWDPAEARRLVLRTHTTAATIRAVARHPEPPLKVFCVGWTYRNESLSYKHLPVFHQVDGVIIDETASLATLLGTLGEFYRKMGFDQVKFKPAFYPYTEPSVDVVVFMPARGRWLEMGGSGIFRPEVTAPLGCRYPVLAWGLGIERLAILRYGFNDIRDLYRPSLDLMEAVPLCR